MRYILAVLILLGLVGSAAADTHYRVRATHVIHNHLPKCSKSTVARMLKTTHIVLKDNGKFYVNRVPYQDAWGDSELPGWASLRYEGNDVIYGFNLYANDREVLGTWTVIDFSGVSVCVSQVAVSGVRL